ncbi:MAG: M67 family metallopeptidase [Sphingomonadaceae bacterium]|nr:M67 family metallopeptidase [Sphingomonadaceae bacterium]
MRLTISRALHDRLIALAAAEPGREVCGLLLGADATVADVVPAANVAADPARRFEIDPTALFAAIRAERAGGFAILGHYHSHPGGDARPSAEDTRLAIDDGRVWVIVAGGSFTAWRRQGDHFAKVAIERVEMSPNCD